MLTRLLETRRKKLTALIIATSSAYGFYKYKTDITFCRNAYFWYNVLPIFVHYKYKELSFNYWRSSTPPDSKAREFNKLHRKYGPRIYHVVKSLNGFYVKIGQMAAQRLDTIPLLWAENLNKLEDQLTPKPMDEVRQVIEESYNCPLESVFSEFEAVPVGTASIGQVHKAVLKATNELVAVKVLHRDAKSFFRKDLRTLEVFTRIAQKQMLPFVKQFQALFAQEFDCLAEAENMQCISRNLQVWAHEVKVPKVHRELCTEEVLVMEFLPGTKLSSSLSDLVSQLRRSEKKRREAASLKPSGLSGQISLRAASLWGYFLGPSCEPLSNFVSAFIARGCALANSFASIFSLGLYSDVFKPPSFVGMVSLRRKIRVLAAVHAHELFVDGFFNPDPHGGNVLLLEDGRLGLLDYGQVARVDEQFRRDFARLIISVDERNWAETAALSEALGFRTSRGDPFVLSESSRLFFGDARTGNEILPQYLERLFKRDVLLDYPPGLFMAGKLAMILRGMSLCFSRDVSMARFWRPFAEECLSGN